MQCKEPNLADTVFSDFSGLKLYRFRCLTLFRFLCGSFSDFASGIEEDAQLSQTRQRPCDRIAQEKRENRTIPYKDCIEPDNSHEAGSDKGAKHR